MYEPRHILISRTQRPSAVADTADTSITVNHGGGGVPPRPDFTAPTRPVSPTPSTTTTRSTYTTTPSAPATRTVTETHRQVNWGGVVKGAALVVGVVLVAAVAYTAVPALLTSLGVIGPNGLVTGLVEAASPAVTSVVETVSPIVTSIGESLLYGMHYAHTAIGEAFTAIGGTAAVESVTSTASAATTAVVKSATGALAAGATAAMAIPLAIKSMAVTPMTELVTQTHTTPVATGLEDGSLAVTQKKSSLAANAAPDHGALASKSDLNMPDLDLTDEAAASMKTASKVAHHAAHAAEGGHGHDSIDAGADAPEGHSRDAVRNSARRSEAWADRVGKREHAAVAPRSGQFAEQLEHDRAQLDAALKTHSV